MVDFDDDEYNSATTPFGRSGSAFGFGGGFGSSGPDSPTLTPIADRGERSFFPSHSRWDSAGSVDSISSGTTRYTSKPSGHSSHSSIATTSTAFSKKPSFASIRNAFKSGKSIDPPPVPSLDHHPYPVLKSPFNRSTSSLTTHVSPVSSRGPFGSFTATSPALSRPPTPGSNPRTKPKNHTYTKSQHSHSGSFFHASDPSSENGPSFALSPPPVPRVPNGFGPPSFSDTSPFTDFEDDKVIMDPKTPTDYALHAVFMQFATSAEAKINTFLREALVIFLCK
jgi:hypothetical protein